MKLRTLLASAAVLVTMSLPVTSAGILTAEDATYQWAPDVRCEDYSATHVAENAGVVAERFPTLDPDMYVEVHLLCLTDAVSEVAPLTDCTSTAYSLTGWRWTSAYTAQWDTSNPEGLSASTILSNSDASGNTWDQAVGADIFGGVSQGGSANQIRRQDFINQMGWKKLGGTTIAVTYTWAYSDGRAAESDAAYNTQFTWNTNGASNAMDFLSIATHEIGHTFGMGHSSTASANSCLTMYPYGANGQTYQRTLGDGDLLGIDAIY